MEKKEKKKGGKNQPWAVVQPGTLVPVVGEIFF